MGTRRNGDGEIREMRKLKEGEKAFHLRIFKVAPYETFTSQNN